uniref:Uncharacterized protein n=1 Tax=Arundo donax TaxID=35708 RepID=A0A0A8ZNB9_ARUDO
MDRPVTLVHTIHTSYISTDHNHIPSNNLYRANNGDIHHSTSIMFLRMIKQQDLPIHNMVSGHVIYQLSRKDKCSK